MTQRMFLVAVVGVLGLTVLSGCTLYDVNVTAYRSDLPMPDPNAPGWIGVVAETQPPEPLLDREIVREIDYLLQEQGYKTGKVDGATYVLAAFAAVDNGRRVVDYYQEYVPGVYGTSEIYTRWGRRAYIQTYYPGYFVTEPYTYVAFNRFLSLTLYDAAKFPNKKEYTPAEAANAIVWRSTADSVGESNDLRRVVDPLLVVSFRHFGEDTGRQVSEVISGRNKQVKALHKAAMADERGHEKRSK